MLILNFRNHLRTAESETEGKNRNNRNLTTDELISFLVTIRQSCAVILSSSTWAGGHTHTDVSR